MAGTANTAWLRLPSRGFPGYQALRQAEPAAMAEGGLDMDRRMKIRAAGTYAIRLATGVVNEFYEMAGTTAIF
jgi:hypothetical protein